MISDDDVEKALDWLRDNADRQAQDRANRSYVEEFRKSLKAQIMRDHLDLPVSAQEREAYADARYIQHLEAVKEAIRIDEHNRFMRASAEAKIEAWRTQSSNQRSMKV